MSGPTNLLQTDEMAGSDIEGLRRQLALAQQQIAALTATAVPGTQDAGLLRGLLDTSDDCVKVLDLEGRLLFMSENGKRVMEVEDFAAIQGCAWPDFWEDANNVAARAAMATARSGGVGRFEGEALTMAGTPKWWDVQVSPIQGSETEPAKLLAVARDITAAHAADAALREAQGLNFSVLNSSRDCTVVLDLEGVTQFVSPGGLESMEVSNADTIVGLSWLGVWTGADGVAARAAVAAATAGEVGRFEGFCPTQRGTPKWWDVMVSPLPGPDGTPERLVAVGRDITDRKLADDEARRLVALVEQSRDFVCVADPDGHVLFVNQAGRDMVGLGDPGHAGGRRLLSYFAPNERRTAARTLAPHVRQHGWWQGEVNLRRFDTGAILPASLNVFPLRDAGGGITGYGAVARDLREVRQAGAHRFALLELGERLRDMDSLGDMSFAAAQIVGQTLAVSGAGYSTMNGSAVCSIDRDWSAPGVGSIAGRHELQDYGSYNVALARGEAVIVADAAADPRTAGNLAALRAISAMSFINLPVLEQGGLVAMFFVRSANPRAWTPEEVGFIHNVTERTRASIERARAQNDLRGLAASLERQVAHRTADRNRLWQLSTDIMLVARFDGMVTAINPAGTKLLGWSEHEMVDRSLFSLIHPDDLAASVAAAKRLSEGSTIRQFVNRYLAKDGSYRWIAWAAVPGDDLINAVGRDITAEREQAAALQLAEERLRQSQKMEAVGQLTGGLAHDFNNLLTVIAGSLELLGTRVAQGRLNGLGRYIEAAQSASTRAASLTHRLLAFSRQQTLDPKVTDVNRLVAGMQELIARTVGPQIAIEVAAADGLWGVLVDPNQLENALLNLCINARDAMPDGGRLLIETANTDLDGEAAEQCELPPGPYLTLSVADTGTGMTPDIIERVFDPFFTTKPIGQGTGLGLSMIYGFARQSGGGVGVQSEPGVGTTMRLFLPRHAGAAEQPATARRADAGPRSSQGETVLIVDDEATVRMLVVEVLEEYGYVAIQAGDAASGLAALDGAAQIDLLVTDVGLPGSMNGRQMADAARASHPTLKVLFITGYAETGDVGGTAMEPGMHVLTKPFTMDALGARIRDLLSG